MAVRIQCLLILTHQASSHSHPRWLCSPCHINLLLDFVFLIININIIFASTTRQRRVKQVHSRSAQVFRINIKMLFARVKLFNLVDTLSNANANQSRNQCSGISFEFATVNCGEANGIQTGVVECLVDE